jgi:hypothetical protein
VGSRCRRRTAGAKHAIQGFTEALRCELLHDEIDVHLTMVQLPALNTPQFRWSRAKVGRQPQPVPPIYDPAIAARAIVWAARARRREILVGGPTLATVLGDKVAPALGDRYLAKSGFDAQTTDEAIAPREGNLFEPVEGDFGAAGPFADDARRSSAQLWLTQRRDTLATAAGALLAAAAVRRRRTEE